MVWSNGTIPLIRRRGPDSIPKSYLVTLWQRHHELRSLAFDTTLMSSNDLQLLVSTTYHLCITEWDMGYACDTKFDHQHQGRRSKSCDQLPVMHLYPDSPAVVLSAARPAYLGYPVRYNELFEIHQVLTLESNTKAR